MQVTIATDSILVEKLGFAVRIMGKDMLELSRGESTFQDAARSERRRDRSVFIKLSFRTELYELPLAEISGAAVPSQPRWTNDETGQENCIADLTPLLQFVAPAGVLVKRSVEIDGGQIQLVGDQDVPANDYYYGTDALGARGYHPLPTSGLPDGDYGDVTVSGGGATIAIDNDVVTNAKAANMGQGTIKLRPAGAGVGDPVDGTPNQASTILDAATDPFARTSALPPTGDFIEGPTPATVTADSLPLWDGPGARLQKQGPELSVGGNVSGDDGKVPIFGPSGELIGSSDSIQPGVIGFGTNSGPGVYGESSGTGPGVKGVGGTAVAVEAENESVTEPTLLVEQLDATNVGPIARLLRANGQGLLVSNDGGLTWTSATGAASSRTGLGLGTAAVENVATVSTADAVVKALGTGKIDLSWLPDSILGQLEYQGVWNGATNTPAIPASSTANLGWFYIVSVAVAAGHGYPNIPNIAYDVGDWLVSSGTGWDKIDNTDAVSSVFGRLGAIVAANGDYTASQVTNVPAGGIAAVTVQGALNELDTEKVADPGGANDDVMQRKAGAWTFRTIAQLLSDLAAPGTTFQPLDSDLTAIAAIAPANDDIIQRKAGAWTNRTMAQLAADLNVSSAANTRSIAQAAHGLAVADVLRFNGTNYVKAQADSSANAEVVGIVSAVADANNFTIITAGYISTLSGLTAGTTYFLSPSTSGLLTATEPTTVGQVSKPVFVATATTAGYFINYRGMLLAAGDQQVVTLDWSATATGNTAATETTLFSKAIAAGQLSTDGNSIEMESSGTFAGTIAVDKRIRVKFGGTTIFDSGNLAITSASDWTLYCSVIRTGAATQRCIVSLNTSFASIAAYADSSSAAETLSGSVTLSITGQGTNASDVVGQAWKVKFMP